MKRFTFVLEKGLKDELEKRSKELGMSSSAYVRSVVIAALKKEKEKNCGYFKEQQ